MCIGNKATGYSRFVYAHLFFHILSKKDILTVELGKFRRSAAGKSADVSDT